MRGFKKFVVCLALLLAALAAAFVRPLPALAVWGDNDEPLPILFGMQLGGDISEHPELAQRSFTFPENWGRGATYEGIPVYPKSYDTFDYKISCVDLYIKVKDFPRFRKLMLQEFGNEILRGDEDRSWTLTSGYYWGKYDVEIYARYPFDKGMVRISFSYLPLDNLTEFGSGRLPDSFTYHDVTLGRKAEEYPFLHPIKEEAPDIVYYQSDEPPLVFDTGYDTISAESETWLAYKGVIYSLELRGDKSDSHFMDRELANAYKLDEYYKNAMSLTPEIRLNNYTIYFKPGFTVMTYMPIYWDMLRAKAKLGK